MSDITRYDVERQWPLVPPVRLEPVAAGTNNRSFIVTTGAARYFLKTYRNMAASDRIRFEHELLRSLDGMHLPFAVPVPIASRSGETMVQIGTSEQSWHASMSVVIPGRVAGFGDEAVASRGGDALAVLTGAFGAVRISPDMTMPDTYGDLNAVHPLILHPVDAIRDRVEDVAVADELTEVVSAVMEDWDRRTTSWTTQIIHSDFYPANVMMEDDRVTGVLDFEFAGLGYRTMDFAIGLGAFGLKTLDNGVVWPLVEAFAGGYLRRQPLSEQELMAVPVMQRMRELTSFVHWLGRMEQELTSPDDIRDRAQRLLALGRWLDRHTVQLVDRLRAIGDVR